jgi:predicted SpoU family rRNA methylase
LKQKLKTQWIKDQVDWWSSTKYLNRITNNFSQTVQKIREQGTVTHSFYGASFYQVTKQMNKTQENKFTNKYHLRIWIGKTQ